MADSCIFTRDEVVIHDKWFDMWVIVNGRVFDLTNLIQKRLNSLNNSLCLLIKYAGKDLSHYFDENGKPLKRINQYMKEVPVFAPAFEKESDESDKFWWQEENYVIGRITSKERCVRIINSMTRKTVYLSVCEEDPIELIQRKYSKFFHINAESYVWRKTFSSDSKSGHLFLDKTLTQNDLLFESNEKLGLPPAFWLFYVLNKD